MDKMAVNLSRLSARPHSVEAHGDPCVRSTLAQTLGLLEKRLHEAVERATVLDSRIMPAPVEPADCSKDCSPDSVSALPTAERCLGLINRLHLVISSMETNVG